MWSARLNYIKLHNNVEYKGCHYLWWDCNMLDCLLSAGHKAKKPLRPCLHLFVLNNSFYLAPVHTLGEFRTDYCIVSFSLAMLAA